MTTDRYSLIQKILHRRIALAVIGALIKKIIALVVLQIGASLRHTFIRKDGLLRRML